MSEPQFFPSPKKGTLRQRIMASVGAMVLLSLLSSTFSLYRMTEVNSLLEAINHVSVPLGRLLTQIQSDAEIYHRELERNLGYSHWKESRWKPRRMPEWIEKVLQNETSHLVDLVDAPYNWAEKE